MATIEERLRTFEDERAIDRLFDEYARAIDYKLEPAQFQDLFTENGSWSFGPAGKYVQSAAVRLTGRQDLGTWYASDAGRGDAGRITKHMIMRPRLQLDGDRATGDAYFTVLKELEEGPRIGTIGRYRATVVRGPDARWRFQELTIEREGSFPVK
jgi:hypothetical protein